MTAPSMVVRTDTPRAWLLVHKTVPGKPGKNVLDRVNDPETRHPDEPRIHG